MVHSRIHELFVVGSATRTNRVSPRGWPGSMRAHTPTLPPTRHGRRPRRIHSLYACAVRGGGGGRGVPRGVGCAPLQTTGAEFLATVTRGIVALVFLWRRCPPGGWRTSATTAQTMTVTPSSSPAPPPHRTGPRHHRPCAHHHTPSTWQTTHVADGAALGGGGHSPHTRSPSPCVHTVLPTVAATADGPRHGGPARWRWPVCGALLSCRVMSRFSMVTRRAAETPLCLMHVVTARRGRRSPSMLLCLSGGGIPAWRGHARDGVYASRWWTPRGDGCPRLGTQAHVSDRPIGRC